MNKRYFEPVHPIELKFGDVPPKNNILAQRFNSYIRLLKSNKLQNEAQVLINLRIARSNYLKVVAHNSNRKNGKPKAKGPYTTSFKKAKNAALKLAKSFEEDPNYPLLCSPRVITDYLSIECTAVGY
ncbi:MAG: hypothetical protein CMF60_04185 [Magnetococcales bacterium]|jgi:hypothetical protein|nr:hypothetical protein [Magnetococcales bacterium]|tara:strand:- start:33054 stop:33434 length:381 start_codon:yes stop_codon:yes gene_type:complete